MIGFVLDPSSLNVKKHKDLFTLHASLRIAGEDLEHVIIVTIIS